MPGCSAAGRDARLFCRRWGCSADLTPGGDARLFCRRSRCPAVLPPVGMLGRSDTRWRCPAVLPPVEIRVGPLCRRSLPGGGYASPRLALLSPEKLGRVTPVVRRRG